MKKLIRSFHPLILASVSFVAMTGCETSHKKELETLMEERDSLTQVNTAKDTMIRNLSSSFDEIEANLASIRQKENTLRVHAGQSGDITDKRSEINHSINEINELMTRNADRIRVLSDRVKRTKANNQELSRLVAVLVDHTMLKNEELIGLGALLIKKDNQLTALGNYALSLSSEIKAQNDTIDAQHKALSRANAQLSTAFFLMGSFKELKAKHLFNAHGKLISDFNKDYFTQIDTRRETFIPEGRPSSKEIIRVLTPHPSYSYEFVKNDQGKMVNLKITDPQEFWSTSKYLVLETK